MPKYIIDGKSYDTDKSTLIVSFRRRLGSVSEAFGIESKAWFDGRLYKTDKSNWFETIAKSTNTNWNNVHTHALSEDEAKQLLQSLNEVELYIEHFGELEEA